MIFQKIFKLFEKNGFFYIIWWVFCLGLYFFEKKTLIFNHSWRQFENSNNLNKKGLIKEFNNKLTKNNILDFIISETKSKKIIFIDIKIF